MRWKTNGTKMSTWSWNRPTVHHIVSHLLSFLPTVARVIVLKYELADTGFPSLVVPLPNTFQDLYAAVVKGTSLPNRPALTSLITGLFPLWASFAEPFPTLGPEEPSRHQECSSVDSGAAQLALCSLRPQHRGHLPEGLSLTPSRHFSVAVLAG